MAISAVVHIKVFFGCKWAPSKCEVLEYTFRKYPKKILNNKPDSEGLLLLFINHILVHSGEKLDVSNLKYHLFSIFPEWNSLGNDFVENRMKNYADELSQIIMSEIIKMDLHL